MKYFMGRHWFNFNRKILKILSGDKEFNKKTYIKYKYIHLFAKYLQRFLVVDFCVPVFYALKMVNFVPEVLEGDKRDKKLSPSSAWGTNEGQNWFFIRFPVENCNAL